MPWIQLLPYLLLIALLAWAAIEDFRIRKIRNWLTLGLVIGGLAQSFAPVHTVGPVDSLLGIIVGGGLLLFPFIVGALGGGDVKLLAAVGAWVGPTMAFKIFVVEAVIGLVIVMIQAAASGKLAALFRNSAVLTVNLVHCREVGVDHVRETGKSHQSIARPLPYAVPILAATLVVLYVSMREGRL